MSGVCACARVCERMKECPWLTKGKETTAYKEWKTWETNTLTMLVVKGTHKSTIEPRLGATNYVTQLPKMSKNQPFLPERGSSLLWKEFLLCSIETNPPTHQAFLICLPTLATHQLSSHNYDCHVKHPINHKLDENQIPKSLGKWKMNMKIWILLLIIPIQLQFTQEMPSPAEVVDRQNLPWVAAQT